MTRNEGGRRLPQIVSTVGLLCAFLSMQAVAAAAASPKFAGRTAQGYHAQFTVQGHNLRILRFTAKLHCRDGSVLTDEESGFQPTPMRSDGSFRDRQSGTTDEVFLRGRLSGKTLRGTLRVTDKLAGSRCDSSTVKFTAQRK